MIILTDYHVKFMSYNDYVRASKMGQKDYQSKLIAGEIPTLAALDDILHEIIERFLLDWYKFH